MLYEIEKHVFGTLLEDDIARAIKETELSKFVLNNLVLKIHETWRQIDHILLLPHKIAIIEAKNSTADVYKVYQNKDIFRYNGSSEDISYSKSIVRQTNKSKTLLKGIFNDYKNIGVLMVEAVGCIRANRLLTYQSDLPIYSDKTLWYYLKSLESELLSFDGKLAISLLEEKLEILKPFIRTSEEYTDYLKFKGVFNTGKITVDDSLTEPKNLKLQESDGGIHTEFKKRETRVQELETLLLRELGKLPVDYRNHALKYPKAPLSSIVEHFYYVEQLIREYPFFYEIIKNSSHYVDGHYIVDYCLIHNIFYIEFLMECLKIFKESYLEEYQKLTSGEITTTSKYINFTRVVRSIIGVTYKR